MLAASPGRLFAAFLLVAPVSFAAGQTAASPASAPSTSEASANKISVQASLVVVPVVVYDKKGLVTTLSQNDFAITVDGKPQSIRYFDRDTDVPLTVGLLVDVSRSQTSVLAQEQAASTKFLESFLKPASSTRPADKAFVLQFAHKAELLQDVTDSHPLLAAALKEIGTEAPGSTDDTDPSPSGQNDPNAGTQSGGNTGNNGGYGRRGGYPGGGGSGNGGSGNRDSQARGGTVLYDSVFLASDDVLSRQKGRRALIVLTDGVDRHSKESLVESIEAAQRADTVVYAVYYKGRDDRGFSPGFGGPGGGYGGYGGGGYGRPGYPGSGGRPGSDGTYADPDGRKILQRICAETGGRMYEVKGKGSVDEIYQQIGDELRAQYRLGFTPGPEAASRGYHPLQLTLTNPANRKFDLQTRDGYYSGPAKPQ